MKKGHGLGGAHAPIAGDAYSPPSIEHTDLTGSRRTGYRDWSPEEKKAYLDHLQAFDKPVKVSPIQPHLILFSVIVGAGAAIGTAAKMAVKAAMAAANQAIKLLKQSAADARNMTVDPLQQAANARSLRDAIDRHHERMTDAAERSREQRAIERREQRERMGIETMEA